VSARLTMFQSRIAVGCQHLLRWIDNQTERQMTAKMTPDPSPNSPRGTSEYMAWLEQRVKEINKAINAVPITEEEQASRLATNVSIATFAPTKRFKP
jgi:hypothetical protein